MTRVFRNYPEWITYYIIKINKTAIIQGGFVEKGGDGEVQTTSVREKSWKESSE